MIGEIFPIRDEHLTAGLVAAAVARITADAAASCAGVRSTTTPAMHGRAVDVNDLPYGLVDPGPLEGGEDTAPGQAETLRHGETGASKQSALGLPRYKSLL